MPNRSRILPENSVLIAMDTRIIRDDLTSATQMCRAGRRTVEAPPDATHRRNPWGNSSFGIVSHEERLQALQDFFEYANSKDDVRIVTAQQLLAWLENPVPL